MENMLMKDVWRSIVMENGEQYVPIPLLVKQLLQQLGYQDYIYSTLSLPGVEDQKIWLNALSCGPGTSCLTACQQCPVSEDYICQHYQDVSIICSSFLSSDNQNEILSCPYNATVAEENNENKSSGGLEFFSFIGGILGSFFVLVMMILGGWVVFVCTADKYGTDCTCVCRKYRAHRSNSSTSRGTFTLDNIESTEPATSDTPCDESSSVILTTAPDPSTPFILTTRPDPPPYDPTTAPCVYNVDETNTPITGTTSL